VFGVGLRLIDPFLVFRPPGELSDPHEALARPDNAGDDQRVENSPDPSAMNKTTRTAPSLETEIHAHDTGATLMRMALAKDSELDIAGDRGRS
jgi:hypothetical protein